MAKRRNRKLPKALTCTCSLRYDIDPPKYMDHEHCCDLWALEDFMNGIVDWDPFDQKLVVLYGDGSTWDGDDLSPTTDLQNIIDATVKNMPAPLPTGGSKWDRYISCRHNMTEVRLPDADGTVVYCSASTDCRGRINRPDYAVYLHGGWSASSIATFVPWEDYGTPYVPWAAVREVVEGFYARAKRGERVEVGCMGGHGRTGTFLAAVVMLADPNMTPEGAVSWVRSHYCHKAVEDASQEYWLRWFADPSLPAHYSRPTPKHTVIGKGAALSGPSCDWTKKGKWCGKNQGHSGPHHYTLKARIEPTPAPAAPVDLPDAERCERLMEGTTLEGVWRCAKAKGHSDYHSFRKWDGDGEACDKGYSGPCTMLKGHNGACVVKVSSGTVKL